MKSSLLLLFGFIMAFSAGTVAQTTLSLRSFGAVPNDGKDDAKAFQKALNEAVGKGGAVVIRIPGGTYNINSRVILNNFTGNITLAGDPGTKIISSSTGGFAQIQALSQEIRMTRPVTRNNSTFTYQQEKGWQIAPGDLISVSSNTPFETAWKYKENDIIRIRSASRGLMQLEDKLLFNYTPASETVKVVVYKKCSLSVKNIDFILTPTNAAEKNKRITILTVVGMSLNMENTNFQYTGKLRYWHLGVSVVAGEGVNFSRIQLNNFMYGVLMNYCRNVKAYDTKVEYSRHGYAPAQACYNVYIEKLRGFKCQSAIDAHPSFLVHYKDVVDTLASEFPNCRSLGTIIEDARFNVRDDFYQLYCYWSVQNLTPEYKALYGEYDTQFKNVYWVSKKPGNFNGLTSYTCRKFLVDNCTTHNIAFYGDQQIMQEVVITNCRAAVIRIDGQKTLVKNTVMDGNLAPTAKYVFRFSGTGQTRFENVTVKNYNRDSVYLFDYFYNQQYMNQLFISNSKIGPLRGWTNKFIYPGKPYPVISVSSSTIAPFKENMPSELNTLPAELLKAKPR
ncbi:glycosyl hydrolase family 28-related protein [Pseudoflavitalea rhizosphaerae]|uniref:glycosyl hydrolase family 28-related protein n=1 Tax=Pseudoflavitalea rhizosphaerae TaxID=1884793 RepID=UPI000F8EBBDE|nr:glycosyl hydrolase family 28-related protein [Pseudoflavitalea rhizosphaerae]